MGGRERRGLGPRAALLNPKSPIAKSPERPGTSKEIRVERLFLGPSLLAFPLRRRMLMMMVCREGDDGHASAGAANEAGLPEPGQH